MRTEGTESSHQMLFGRQVSELLSYLNAQARALELDAKAIQKFIGGNHSAMIKIENHERRGLPKYILYGESRPFFDCNDNLQQLFTEILVEISKNTLSQFALHRMQEKKPLERWHFDMLIQTPSIRSGNYPLIQTYTLISSKPVDGFFHKTRTPKVEKKRQAIKNSP